MPLQGAQECWTIVKEANEQHPVVLVPPPAIVYKQPYDRSSVLSCCIILTLPSSSTIAKQADE